MLLPGKTRHLQGFWLVNSRNEPHLSAYRLLSASKLSSELGPQSRRCVLRRSASLLSASISREIRFHEQSGLENAKLTDAPSNITSAVPYAPRFHRLDLSVIVFP